MNRLQDEELVVLCLQGNRDAFAELVKRYERQIYSLAYRLTNNYHDAIDLSQEVFLHLYRVLDKFDGERKFFPWMYRIATNVCYNALKKKPKESTTLDQVMEFISDDKSQPEITFEKKEVQETVQKAIAELPENFRVPVVLKYLEDLSYQQISEVMELPVSTIETRLYRGRIMLQKKLKFILERGAKSGMSSG
ncbi:RNA polymerase sigma factor [Dehalobacterium formicoaceticum]|uniref:Sigma-70 family RNA polymerase sigma factor n=1 Tax=Dehalobacterium formicoaceticum TaxID=51515 RepID=A0ABT1Y3L0_9FIRM|nr:sigma-70 family RNA polymerase sigma factor [Dehalobacterium formicoaceticum]